MTKYLNNLTPMRGIAALLTVLFHFNLMLGGGGEGIVKDSFSPIFNQMYLMVDFFFVLSGFIMFYVYGEMFSEGFSWKNFKIFFRARIARLYPLHLVTLLFCILLFSLSAKMGIEKFVILEAENNVGSIISNVFMVHSLNLHQWFSWNHASWSISVEWAAYMVFPFLVAPFMKLQNWGKVAIFITCFVGYLGIAFYIVPIVTVHKDLFFLQPDLRHTSINLAFQYGFLRCIFGFILGMMMYEAYRIEWAKKSLSNGYVLAILTIASFLAMHFQLPDYIVIIPFPFIILSGAYGSERINRFFENNALQKLGDWSFSIYMIHQPLMFLVNKIFIYNKVISDPKNIVGNWLIVTWLLPTILILSYLTYRFVEIPARKWINGRSI